MCDKFLLLTRKYETKTFHAVIGHHFPKKKLILVHVQFMYIKNLCGHIIMLRFAINCNKGERFEDQKVHFNGPKRRK